MKKSLQIFFLGAALSVGLIGNAGAFELFGTGNDGEETSAAIMSFMAKYLEQDGKNFEQQYKILQNTIKQLETQGKQLEKQLEEATGLDFSAIKWNASDSIKGSSFLNGYSNAWEACANVSEKLQKYYNDINSVWQSMEDAKVLVDGIEYTLEDIANAGMPNVDFSSFGSAIINSTIGKFGEQADEWACGLTRQEQEYIWKRYGMSPSDYYLTRQMSNETKQMTDRLTARVDSRIKAVQDDRAAVNAAIRQANAQIENTGVTDKQLAQISAKTNNTMLATMESLKEILQDKFTQDIATAQQEATQQKAEERANAALEEAFKNQNYNRGDARRPAWMDHTYEDSWSMKAWENAQKEFENNSQQ